MSDNEQNNLDRLKSILTKLLQYQLSESLNRVESSLKSWRDDKIGVFEAHAEVLKHAVRAERMAGRIAQASQEPSGPILRDAFDAELIGRDEFRELVGCDPEDVEPASAADDSMGLPLKQAYVSELLDEGPVLVHVDARVKGVSVPLHLKQDAKLVLRFGYGLKPEIHDLTVDEDAIAGTLTFQGIPHRCVLPWSAVYAAVSEANHRGMVWPEEVPPEVLEQLGIGSEQLAIAPDESPEVARLRARQEEVDKSKSARRRASHLKLVD
ncbi:MAG: ClpXP protease specificity-enhancing factor SspB [Proteobacteria bacterium]|nr:ClpXP protease specificity-enhancing factor SspB [Pseudomonadota bacterium]